MPNTLDAIVLGLGAMGAAATYQLAKRGARVLGIDQYDPPHAFGSSHGDTRITRIACGEGPEYSAFARRSHEIWRALEAETGVELLTQNGLLVLAGPGERAPSHGVPRFLAATIDAADGAATPVTMTAIVSICSAPLASFHFSCSVRLPPIAGTSTVIAPAIGPLNPAPSPLSNSPDAKFGICQVA